MTPAADHSVRTLEGLELHRAWGDDPFVRWDIAQPHTSPIRVYGDAVAFERTSHSRHLRSLTMFGPPADVAVLLRAVATHLQPEVNGISIERVNLPLLHEHFGERLSVGGNWDWMWTTMTPPVIPAEQLLHELDDTRDADEIRALNAIGNPTAESEPGTGTSEYWLGLRESGRLIVAGALHRTGGGAPHLTGLVVHPDARGRRLGLALTAALTRRAVERDGVATLGMYADNDRARSVYAGLGYQVARAWASRRLRPA
ncbi:GNAT family N-acetyltransferase [Rudaeicoccus suwonensis]|uniref:GNAT family N-acetyltransferase n=1 Tax=Rudaeicoccus suwonensis TaxID=657409 RepID=UPI001476AA48|nr:GNAT family N-acetyltransferase [Rudaeicoccus suwonensis]